MPTTQSITRPEVKTMQKEAKNNYAEPEIHSANLNDQPTPRYRSFEGNFFQNLSATATSSIKHIFCYLLSQCS